MSATLHSISTPAPTASEGFVSVGTGKTELETEPDTPTEVGQVLDTPEGRGRKAGRAGRIQ